LKVQVVKRGKAYRVMQKHRFWFWTYVKAVDKISEMIPGVRTHWEIFQTTSYSKARDYAEEYAARNFAHFDKEIRNI